jgi:hypothetical protein
MLRTRLDAAAVGKLALVVGWYMLRSVLVPDLGCCQANLHGARESRRNGAGFARGTAVADRSRKRLGSIAYFRTL